MATTSPPSSPDPAAWLEVGENDPRGNPAPTFSNRVKLVIRHGRVPPPLFITVCVFLLGSVLWAGIVTIQYINSTGGFGLQWWSNDTTPGPNDNLIHIVHFNDVYQLTPQNGRGGMGLAGGVVDFMRQVDPDTLVTLAGDVISPSAESTILKGAQMIAGLNALGLNVSCFGNHEFDFPLSVLNARLSESNFSWVNSNLLLNGQLYPQTVEFTSFDIPRANAKVCFYGLIYDISKSGYFVPIEVLDQYTVSKSIVQRLRSVYNCTVVVALTHQSLMEDCALSGAGDAIDVILGGHEHDVMFEKQCGTAPYIKATSDFFNVWVLELRLNSQGQMLSIRRKSVPLSTNMPVSAVMQEVLATWNAKLGATLDKLIGSNTVTLDYRTNIVRTQESNLGDYVADSMKKQVNCDVAIINGGGVRGNSMKAPGKVLKKDIINWHPFNEDILQVRINGSILFDLLTWGVQLVDMIDGRFPQISGFRFTFRNIPNGDNVVTEITWPNGTLINPSDSFILGTLPFYRSSAPSIASIPELPIPRGNVLASIEENLSWGRGGGGGKEREMRKNEERK